MAGAVTPCPWLPWHGEQSAAKILRPPAACKPIELKVVLEDGPAHPAGARTARANRIKRHDGTAAVSLSGDRDGMRHHRPEKIALFIPFLLRYVILNVTLFV